MLNKAEIEENLGIILNLLKGLSIHQEDTGNVAVEYHQKVKFVEKHQEQIVIQMS